MSFSDLCLLGWKVIIRCGEIVSGKLCMWFRCNLVVRCSVEDSCYWFWMNVVKEFWVMLEFRLR